jgi:hypothetical protein
MPHISVPFQRPLSPENDKSSSGSSKRNVTRGGDGGGMEQESTATITIANRMQDVTKKSDATIAFADDMQDSTRPTNRLFSRSAPCIPEEKHGRYTYGRSEIRCSEDQNAPLSPRIRLL